MHATLATAPTKWSWYRLTSNGTGHRALWISAEDAWTTNYPNYPHLVSMAISPGTPKPLIRWTNDIPADPALWAFPTMDFDEALGFTVIGNCFGELAIYDSIDSDPTNCCGLGVDFTGQNCVTLPLISLTPVPLNLRLAPRKLIGESAPDRSLVSHWIKDDLPLDRSFWCTDMFCDRYCNWDAWQGNLGDNAWCLNHAFGFPILPIPQAHALYRDDDDTIYVIVRSGNRYLAWNQDFAGHLRSFETPLPQPLHSDSGQLQPYMRPTAFTEVLLQETLFRQEYYESGGRNRWIEHEERGGHPHKNLVDTISLNGWGV
ncbi:hypothetical protein C8R47DRAFT_422000 [Mycena vitilis]|nr:hypothetical protein C8R47DRAFT_422000 [Mycena vitilis]